jgi:hypothetical protein
MNPNSGLYQFQEPPKPKRPLPPEWADSWTTKSPPKAAVKLPPSYRGMGFERAWLNAVVWASAVALTFGLIVLAILYAVTFLVLALT